MAAVRNPSTQEELGLTQSPVVKKKAVEGPGS